MRIGLSSNDLMAYVSFAAPWFRLKIAADSIEPAGTSGGVFCISVDVP